MVSSRNNSNLWLIGATSTVAVALSVVIWCRVTIKHPSDDQHDDDSDQASYSQSGEGSEVVAYHLPLHLQREVYKEQRRQEKIPLLAMKKPMYDNIRMLDPQGTLLCTISKKKAKWYVNKKLASWKDDQETTMQLLFEPSHRSNQSNETDSDNFFNKSIKENICVVCGDDKYHMRHYIVPYSCRSLFPNKYKMHMAHDVVILCPDCHLECKKLATNRVKFLEKQSRRDLKTAIPHFTNRVLYKVKSCSLALLKWRNKLPPATIDEYEALVRSHFELTPEDDLSTSILQQASELETEIPNPDYVPAAEVIVDAFCRSDDDIESFVKGWRNHFVETMQPGFLPKGWSVDSSVECESADRRSGQ